MNLALESLGLSGVEALCLGSYARDSILLEVQSRAESGFGDGVGESRRESGDRSTVN
jgi:hypothetical protein